MPAKVLYCFATIYRYMNSKIRRSRTYLERRKNSASKRPIEHTVSSKEVLNLGLYHMILLLMAN